MSRIKHTTISFLFARGVLVDALQKGCLDFQASTIDGKNSKGSIVLAILLVQYVTVLEN